MVLTENLSKSPHKCNFEITKPYFSHEMEASEVDWEYFSEVALTHPAIEVLYELFRSDPTTTGHADFFRLLDENDTFRNALNDSIYKFVQSNPEFHKKVIHPLFRAAVIIDLDQTYETLLNDSITQQTAQLCRNILALLQESHAPKRKNHKYYFQAFEETSKYLGPRHRIPANLYEKLLEWDKELSRRINLLEFMENENESTFRKQRDTLIALIDKHRDFIIVQSLCELFSSFDFGIGLEEKRDFNGLVYYPGVMPITVAELKKLKVVNYDSKSSEPASSFYFVNGQGERTQLCVRPKDIESQIQFNKINSFESPLYVFGTTEYTRKYSIIRSGQLVALKNIEIFLKMGNYAAVIKLINDIFIYPIEVPPDTYLQTEIEMDTRRFEAFPRQFFTEPSEFGYFTWCKVYLTRKDKHAIEKGDQDSAKEGKPNLLDELPEDFFAKLMETNHSTYDGSGESNIANDDLAIPPENDAIPENTSKESFEKSKHNYQFHVTFPDKSKAGIGYLFFGEPNAPKSSVNEKSNYQITPIVDQFDADLFISSHKRILASGEYIRIPLPLYPKLVTSTLFFIDSNNKRHVLTFEEDYNFVTDITTGLSSILLQNQRFYNGIFEFAVGVSIYGKKDQTEEKKSIGLQRHALEQTADVFSNHGYTAIASLLNILVTRNQEPTSLELEMGLKRVSFYSFTNQYLYKNTEKSELERLSGFLDNLGFLHIQCNGAAAIFQEVIAVYNSFVGEEYKIKSKKIGCVRVPSSGILSAAEYHQMNAISGVHNEIEESMVLIDTTPNMLDDDFVPITSVTSVYDLLQNDFDAIETEEVKNEKIYQKIIQLKEEATQLLNLTYPHRKLDTCDQTDPLVAVAKQLFLVRDSKDAIELVSLQNAAKYYSSRLDLFMGKALEERSLFKKYPHYQDVMISIRISQLINNCQTLLAD